MNGLHELLEVTNGNESIMSIISIILHHIGTTGGAH